MKTVLLFRCALVACTLGQAASPELPIRLAISTASDRFPAGSPISVNVVLTNTSDHEIRVSEETPERDFTVLVTRDDGASVPQTAYAKTYLPAGIGSRRLMLVKPNQDLTEILPLSKLYDMTLPGNYEVIIQKEMWDRGKTSRIESNRLPIEVTY